MLHKIEWFKEAHEITKDKDEIRNYWMFKEYRELVESGEQQVSTSMHLLFEYLDNVISELDIYLDITLTEHSYYTPKQYFPHDLYEWERFLLPIIFGLRFTEDDTLVFNEYFLYMARGGGKNYFMAWVIFALTSSINGIPHYDVAISASSERQAQRSYLDIMEVIENNPALGRSFKKTKKEMEHRGTKSNFRYLSSNGQTMDGQRLGLAYLDEIHAISDYQALVVMRSSLGKIPDKRLAITSTDGYTRGKVLDDYKERCLDILNGKLGVLFSTEDTRHNRTFPFMHHADNDEEVRTIVGWQKANPTVLKNKDLLQTYREESALIDTNPELNIEFHLKRVNVVKEDTRFAVAKYEDILRTSIRDIFYYRDQLNIYQVDGSVDFSSMKDLTTVAINGRYGDEFYSYQHSFMLRSQRHAGLINEELLRQAEQQGKLTVLDAELISEQVVVQWFQARRDEGWQINTIHIDQYKSGVLGGALEHAGFLVNRVNPNMLNETLISPVVDKAFTEHSLFVGEDVLFRWATGNVYKSVLSKGIRYDKIDPVRRKTDPFSCLTNYLIGTLENPNKNENLGFYGTLA